MRKWLTGILVLVVLLVAMACTPQAAPASPPTPKGKQLLKWVVALPMKGNFTSNGGEVIAKQAGFYAEEGLDVSFIFVTSGPELVTVLLTGDAQQTTQAGIGSIFAAYAQGVPIRIVNALDPGLDTITYWYVKADSPIRELKDLQGKTMLYSRPGAGTHVALLALSRLFEQRGWKPPKLIQGGSIPDAYTMAMTGQTDTGWSSYPDFNDKLISGELRVIWQPGRDTPEIFAGSLRAGFITTNTLKERPEAARAYLKGTNRGWQMIKDKPLESFRFWEAAGFKSPPIEVQKEAPKWLDNKNWGIGPVVRLEEAMKDAVKSGFLQSPLNANQLKELYHPEFLPRQTWD